MTEQQGTFQYRLISSKTLPETHQTTQEDHHENTSSWMDDIVFTQKARQALTYAFTKSISLRHNYIDSCHILLGLLDDPQDLPAIIVAHFANIENIKEFIRTSIQPGYDITLGERYLTTAYKVVIQRAAEEAQKFHLACVGSEHLLLALAYDLSGISGSVFLRSGINVDDIRKQIQQITSL